jgi:glycosyltransferase involved in cell wall biosynthesis
LNDKDYPLVTVVTLIYNTNPKFVIEAIESVRANNYSNIQHIIIDDCSPDPEPKEVVKNWIQENNYSCEFYEHDENYGICRTLNHVLDLSKGKYLIGCCDDLLKNNAIPKMVQFFELASDDCKIVFGDIDTIDENNKILNNTFFSDKCNPNSYISFEKYLKNECRFPTVGCMYKVKDLVEIGMYDERLRSEDYDMHLRLLKIGKATYVGNIAASYRRHSNQISQNFGVKYYDDRILILMKHFDAKGDTLKYIESKIRYYSILSYLNNTHRQLFNLKIALGIRFELKLFILLMLSFFKIKPKYYLISIEKAAKFKNINLFKILNNA